MVVAPVKTSRGGVDGHALKRRQSSPLLKGQGGPQDESPACWDGNRLVGGSAGVEPGPRGTKRKRGRPRIGDPPPDTPWKAMKMSRSTWYRRQKENGK